MLHFIGKQAYMLNFPQKWKIYIVFHVSFLHQNIIRKKQADENVIKMKFQAGNNKEYKVKTIRDSVIYKRKFEMRHLSKFYYLVFEKGYPKKNIWKPSSRFNTFGR